MRKEIEALITYNEVAVIKRIILYWKCKQKKKMAVKLCWEYWE
jgi:hypothetical protein